MIYFDNCSTTHKKPKCVISAINKGLKKYNYNPGRASYDNAIKANLKVLRLRDNASLFFGTDSSSNIVITKSCTESLNIAIRSNVRSGGHIISTIFEHNSVLRTLEFLKQNNNIVYTLLKPNKDGFITINEIEKSITPKTYMIVINHISNVVGTKQDIENIGKLCKKHNLIFVVDGAQSAGHTDINMQKMNINYLAIAGHKGVYGPQGIGLLVCKNAKPEPLLFGGTGTYSEKVEQPHDLPEGLESGTMSMANIMGLSKGIEYVTKKRLKIEAKITKLTNYLIDKLKKLDNIVLYSNSNNCTGVVSFNVKGYTSNEIATILNKHGFETRSGLHCAPKVHEHFNTLKTGMVRIGLSHYNSIRQINKLINTLSKIN